ncbi:MAG: Z-ring formation inhibitor MciZ [Bacillota bacterium]
MVELIYPNRIYISGDMKTVQMRLSEYARHYTTVKELLAAKAPAPDRQ